MSGFSVLHRTAGAAFLAVTLLLSGTAQTAAQAEPGLDGAWVVERIVSPERAVDEEPDPGLFLYTEGHYSHMIGDSSRTELSDDPSAAEQAAAFEGFVSNTGRYEVRGDSLILRPFVAKLPYRMNDFPDHTWTLTYRLSVDTFWLRTPGGTEIVLRRADGSSLPH